MKAFIEIEAETELQFYAAVDSIKNVCERENTRCTIVPLDRHAKMCLVGVEGVSGTGQWE
jgi:hypothetical protein